MKTWIKLILLIFVLQISTFASEVKIGSEVNIVGVRPNYLTGYGIVVGLKGTGDGTTSIFTLQSIANMLKKMGIFVDPKAVKTKNAAAVIVTAKLPPFAKAGMTFDVTVASLGDAKSIENGILLEHLYSLLMGRFMPLLKVPFQLGEDLANQTKGGKFKRTSQQQVSSQTAE